MAQLVLGVVGGVAGSLFGQPQLGYAIGSALGGALFPPDLGTVTGPRLNPSGLAVNSNALGSPIPIIYGTIRTPTQVIWAQPIKETQTATEAGGKGGPTQTQVTYSYSGTFAVAVCKGEIAGITRIWADNALIYSKSSESSISESIASDGIEEKLTIYNGSETQEANPVIESYEGSGNVPAYRGLAYMVFDDIPLEKYGNRIPGINVEVVKTGSSNTAWEIAGNVGEPVGLIKKLENETLIAFTGTYIAPTTSSGSEPGSVYLSYDYGETWEFRKELSSQRRCYLLDVDPVYRNKIFAVTDDGKLWKSLDYGESWNYVSTFGAKNNPARSILIYDSSTLFIGMYSGQLYKSTDDGLTFTNIAPATATYYALVKPIDGIILASNTQGNTFLSVDLGITWETVLSLGGSAGIRNAVTYDGKVIAVSANGRIHRSLDYGYTWTELTSPIIINHPITYHNGITYLTSGYGAYESTDDGDNWTLNSLVTSNINIGVIGLSGLILLTSNNTSDLTGTVYIYKGNLVTEGSSTLADVVSDLCANQSLSASDIDVSPLTDTVRGYIVNQGNAKRSIYPLAQAYQFDSAESDFKLKFIKRAQ